MDETKDSIIEDKEKELKSAEDKAKERRFKELEKLLTKDIVIDNNVAEDLWSKEVMGVVGAKKAFEKLSKEHETSKNMKNNTSK